MREYLIDRNGRQAAIRAGYGEKSAAVQACKLQAREHVAAAIAEGTARQAAAAELKAENILRTIVEGLDFDPARLFDDNGNLLAVVEMPLGIRRHLRSVKVVRIPGRKDGAETVELRWTALSDWTAQGAKVLGMEKDPLSDALRSHAELVAEAMRRAVERKTGGGQ